MLDDLLSFFEASPIFIGVACEKLRKQQGPMFTEKKLRAFLNLRNDLDKDTKAQCLKSCMEILENFKHSNFDE